MDFLKCLFLSLFFQYRICLEVAENPVLCPSCTVSVFCMSCISSWFNEQSLQFQNNRSGSNNNSSINVNNIININNSSNSLESFSLSNLLFSNLEPFRDSFPHQLLRRDQTNSNRQIFVSLPPFFFFLSIRLFLLLCLFISFSLSPGSNLSKL